MALSQWQSTRDHSRREQSLSSVQEELADRGRTWFETHLRESETRPCRLRRTIRPRSLNFAPHTCGPGRHTQAVGLRWPHTITLAWMERQLMPPRIAPTHPARSRALFLSLTITCIGSAAMLQAGCDDVTHGAATSSAIAPEHTSPNALMARFNELATAQPHINLTSTAAFFLCTRE